jgi:hypothetical protein
MNIRRIIREEINNDLLMEGKLNDMFKKFNMTQIKKELKERLDIDETSTKMEVAKKLIKYSYKLNLKLLKYELGAILGGFIFYFISAVLDITGVEPFVTDGEPTMPHFILWGAGALLNVIRMVRKDLKEEDGLQWIKDIKPIPELKIGTCFIDVMDSTKTEWIIIDFKMTPGGTHIVVIKNKKNNVDIRYKHEGYFEEDLLTGRYKPC